MGRAINLEVKLPAHVKPTDETSEQLIKKFLKECSKESLVQYMYENSAWTRRFNKRSDVERARRIKHRKTAQRNQQELNNEIPKQTKKQGKHQQTSVNKQ